MELEVSNKVNKDVYNFIRNATEIWLYENNSACLRIRGYTIGLWIDGKKISLSNCEENFEMNLNCDIADSDIYNEFFKTLYNHIQTLLGFYKVDGQKIVGGSNSANVRRGIVIFEKIPKKNIFEFEYPKGLFTADNIYDKVCELLDVKEEL